MSYDESESWTADDSEQRLDEIEAEIADVILANQTSAYWDAIEYVDRSTLDGVELGGYFYRVERLVFECRKVGA